MANAAHATYAPPHPALFLPFAQAPPSAMFSHRLHVLQWPAKYGNSADLPLTPITGSGASRGYRPRCSLSRSYFGHNTPRHRPADKPDGGEGKPVGSLPALQSDVPLSGQWKSASAFLHSYSCSPASEDSKRELPRGGGHGGLSRKGHRDLGSAMFKAVLPFGSPRLVMSGVSGRTPRRSAELVARAFVKIESLL